MLHWITFALHKDLFRLWFYFIHDVPLGLKQKRKLAFLYILKEIQYMAEQCWVRSIRKVKSRSIFNSLKQKKNLRLETRSCDVRNGIDLFVTIPLAEPSTCYFYGKLCYAVLHYLVFVTVCQSWHVSHCSCCCLEMPFWSIQRTRRCLEGNRISIPFISSQSTLFQLVY